MNEPATPAHPAQKRPLGVANARRGPRYGCALRLDWALFGGLLGRARFIHNF
ncbi:hypothetical protein [Tibeticola sp.]|uniref:hypothetical protein n=1 Tax=Tibeticola sp. TaxID=2005368 RepID=UPI0025D65BAE|nr:hypothetical protein [Tibeticola sp.]